MYRNKKFRIFILIAVVFVAIQGFTGVLQLFGESVAINDEEISNNNPELLNILNDILENQNLSEFSQNYDELSYKAEKNISILEKGVIKLISHSANFINIGNSKGNIDAKFVYDIEGLTENKQEYINSFSQKQYEGWLDLTETLDCVKMNIRSKNWEDLSREEQVKIVSNMCVWDGNTYHMILKNEIEKFIET